MLKSGSLAGKAPHAARHRALTDALTSVMLTPPPPETFVVEEIAAYEPR